MDQLVALNFDAITCLTRRPELMAPRVHRSKNISCIPGELNRPAAYCDALGGHDLVVHLAAATASAAASELTRTNVEGTQLLLNACRSQGVRNVLYVSSIAASYADLEDYPYGRTKLEAEQRVRESGLEYVILRPTIVLGERSHTWKMLRKLAVLPIIPLFQGGAIKVQPVDVVDVARAIVAIISGFSPEDPLVEMGGPEVVTFADFLLRIRAACGQSATKTVSIPVWPTRVVLKTMDRLFGGRFPVSAGQLSPFLHDGTAKPNALYSQLKLSMVSLDSLLRRIANARRQ